MGLGGTSWRHARAASRVALVDLASSSLVMLKVSTLAISVFNSASEIRASGLRAKMRLRILLHESLTGKMERKKSGLAK